VNVPMCKELTTKKSVELSSMFKDTQLSKSGTIFRYIDHKPIKQYKREKRRERDRIVRERKR
jgi:hypothetical protein